MVKHCRDCLELLELNEFYNHSGCKLGVRPECKKCTHDNRRAYIEEYKKKNITKTIQDVMKEIADKEFKKQNEEFKSNFILSFRTQKVLEDL